MIVLINATTSLEAQLSRDSLIIPHALFHIRVTGREMSGDEAEARIVVLETDRDCALVASDALEPGLLLRAFDSTNVRYG